MSVNLENLKIDLPERAGATRAKNGAGWKILSLLLALALVAFAVYHYSSRGESDSVLTVDISPVIYSGGKGESLFTAGGWVEPAFPCPVEVSALASGRIEKLNVVESSIVEKGQTIAVLYKKDFKDEVARAEAELRIAKARFEKLTSGFRPEEVEQARASLQQVQANLMRLEAGYRKEEVEKAKALLAEAKAQESNASEIWERSRQLYEKGAISKEEFDNSKSDYESSIARAASVSEALKLLESGYRKEDIEQARAKAAEASQKLKLLESGYRKEEIDEAKALVEKAAAAFELASSKLGYADVKAPVSGRILELYARQGDYITAGKSAIVSIYNPADLQVRVDIRQENVSKMGLGQPARIMTDARKNEPYEGEIIRIDPKANLARDTVRAKVRIIEPDEFLYPEMTATVDFLSETKKEGKPKLLMPREAIFSEGGGSYVFVIEGGVARKTAVMLGEDEGGYAEVVSGVGEGSFVAVSDIGSLKDGQRIGVKD